MTKPSPAETAHLLTLDLYAQVLALREENVRLRTVLAQQQTERVDESPSGEQPPA